MDQHSRNDKENCPISRAEGKSVRQQRIPLTQRVSKFHACRPHPYVEEVSVALMDRHNTTSWHVHLEMRTQAITTLITSNNLEIMAKLITASAIRCETVKMSVRACDKGYITHKNMNQI